MRCATGQITWLRGSGPARAPFLIHWAGRPVGGGSVDRAGHWAIPLMVGQERPGLYHVEVRTRNDRALIGAFQCAVGVTVPTPLPPTASPTPVVQDLDRSGDGQITCVDFNTQAEAKVALAKGYTNLDNDGDGIPCESLP
jgi:hypothetical protein